MPDAAAAIADPKPGAEAGIWRPWHGFYWKAWAALRADRPYGAFGGEGAISFVAIDAYARRFRIEGADFETFHHLIAALDAEWLEHVAENLRTDREAES